MKTEAPDLYAKMVGNNVAGSRLTPSEIELALDTAFGWFKGNGVDLMNTRFGHYRRFYAKMKKAMLAPTGALWHALDQRDAFATAAEIIDCIEIATLPTGVIANHIDKLRRYATGDRFYGASSPDSYDQGRDIASELLIAATLARQCHSVSLEDPTDIALKLPDTNVYIECKRPKTISGLARCLKRASNQFSAHRRNDYTGTAIVALDLTRVLNPTLQIIAAESQLDAVEIVQGLINRFMDQSSKKVLRYQRDFKKDAEIDGVFIRATIVSFTKDRSIDVATATQIRPQGPPDSPPYSRCVHFRSLFTEANNH